MRVQDSSTLVMLLQGSSVAFLAVRLLEHHYLGQLCDVTTLRHHQLCCAELLCACVGPQSSLTG